MAQLLLYVSESSVWSTMLAKISTVPAVALRGVLERLFWHFPRMNQTNLKYLKAGRGLYETAEKSECISVL